MSYQKHKAGLLAAFRKYESMGLLLTCVPRSPAVWDDIEDEEKDEDRNELAEELISKGLLEEHDGGWMQTTAKGREALIAYIEGE